jgi:hypothetical protein
VITIAAAGDEATITAPVRGSTVQTSAAFSWIYDDQTAYQVRRVADASGIADPSTVYYDSGTVTSSSTKSVTLTFATDRWEHLQVRCKNPAGLWTPWADDRVLRSANVPPTPTLTVTEQPDEGSITLTITTPAPTGSQLTATSVQVHISFDGGATDAGILKDAAALPITGDYVYFTPGSDTDYAFQVWAVAGSGASAITGWITLNTDLATVIGCVRLWYGDATSPPNLPQAEINDVYYCQTTGDFFELEET